MTMKTSLLIFALGMLCLVFPVTLEAAVALQEAPEAIHSRQELKAQKQFDRQQKRMEKRMDRWAKRIQKWQTREDNTGKRTLSLILGSIALLGGIVLGILAFGSSLGGFFLFLSGLLVVGGIILLLFALLKKPAKTEG